MKVKIIGTSLALMISSPAIAQSDRAVDGLLNSSGLSTLEGEERVAARTLVRRLLVNRSTSGTLENSAKEYIRNEGYEPVHLSMIYSDGDYFLVARSNLTAYATKDLPFGIGSALFEDGEYFAKRNIVSGGVSEFIDEDGNVQRLMFAEWFSLR